jgi:hypothetical protein
VHVDRYHPVAGAGRLRTPHAVEQLLSADRPARPEQQGDQKRLFTHRPEIEIRSAPPGLERPEQREAKLLIRVCG